MVEIFLTLNHPIIMKSYKRHVAKSLSWRLIGTIDTFILSYLLTGSFYFGLSISLTDTIIKLFLYFFHERVWFQSKYTNPNVRHILKTLSWRLIGSISTLLIAWIVTGNPLTGLKISFAETLTKLILYYLHEKLWYRSNFDLDKRKKYYEG